LGGPNANPPPRCSLSCRETRDRARLEVDVGPAQRGQLTPAQAAENGEQDQGAVPAADRIGQGVDLGNGQNRPLR